MKTTKKATNWSEQQKGVFKFFSNPEGHLVVRARAGTGKTTTIINALPFLAAGVKVLVCAFNKSIAEELVTRLLSMKLKCNATAKTLHSLGLGLLKRSGDWRAAQIKDGRGWFLAEKACGTKAPKEIITLTKKLASIGKNATPFASVLQLTDLAYGFALLPDPKHEKEGWTVEKIAQCAHGAMDLAKNPSDGLIDFDDMVWLPVVLGLLVPMFDMVVVDEAQDMNPTQLLLAEGVCNPGGSIVVVGDDRQGIYTFRGADSNALDRLKTKLSAEERSLTTTYRCPKAVVELAARLVPDYTAAGSAPEGTVDELHYTKLVSEAQIGDFILSRTNAPLAKTCMALLRAGKKARIQGRDIGATLKAIVEKLAKGTKPEPVTDNLLEVLTRLQDWRENQVAQLTKKYRDAESRAKVIEMIDDQVETIEAFCEGLNTVSQLTARLDELFLDNNGPRIMLSSVHKAKGLEADRVFLLEWTFYPRGNRNIEEDNIRYVALTRAKKHLTLVSKVVA